MKTFLTIYTLIFSISLPLKCMPENVLTQKSSTAKSTIAHEACIVFKDKESWEQAAQTIFTQSPYDEFSVTHFFAINESTDQPIYPTYLVQPTLKRENLHINIKDIQNAYKNVPGVLYIDNLDCILKKSFKGNQRMRTCLEILKKKALQNILMNIHISKKDYLNSKNNV